MKKMMILTLLLTSFTSIAGIKEKKAIRANKEKIEKGVSMVKSKCGNKALKADHPFKSCGNAENLGMHGYKLEAFFGGVADVCSDADYKEEIAKIEMIKITCNGDQKAKKNSYKLSNGGKTLEAVVVIMMNNDKYEVKKDVMGIF